MNSNQGRPSTQLYQSSSPLRLPNNSRDAELLTLESQALSKEVQRFRKQNQMLKVELDQVKKRETYWRGIATTSRQNTPITSESLSKSTVMADPAYASELIQLQRERIVSLESELADMTRKYEKILVETGSQAYLEDKEKYKKLEKILYQERHKYEEIIADLKKRKPQSNGSPHQPELVPIQIPFGSNRSFNYRSADFKLG